jgi:hypothetical protein
MSSPDSSFYLELTRLLGEDQISVRLMPGADGAMALEAWRSGHSEPHATFPLGEIEQVEENAEPVAAQIRAHYAERRAPAD